MAGAELWYPSLVRTLLLVLTLFFLASPSQADEWTGTDKTIHFGVSAAFSATGYAVSAPLFDNRWAPLLIGTGVSIGLGATKELYDLSGRGDPSWKDFTWDVLGAVTGALLAWSIDCLVRGVSNRHPAFDSPSALVPPAR